MPPRLLGVEGVEAADDDAGLGDVADVGDLGVLQDRPLDDQLAVLDFDRGDLHRHPGAEAGGEAGADLEAEQAAAEQGVGDALVLMTLAIASTIGWARPSGTLLAR